MKVIQDRLFWVLLFIAVGLSVISILLEIQNIHSLRDRAELHRNQQQIMRALERLEARP